MPHPPPTFVSVSCLLLSLGFMGGVSTASCIPQQAKVVKDAMHIVNEVCDLKDVLPEEADRVCVTEDELRRALKDIVSARKAAGSSGSSKGSLVVVLPPKGK